MPQRRPRPLSQSRIQFLRKYFNPVGAHPVWSPGRNMNPYCIIPPVETHGRASSQRASFLPRFYYSQTHVRASLPNTDKYTSSYKKIKEEPFL